MSLDTGFPSKEFEARTPGAAAWAREGLKAGEAFSLSAVSPGLGSSAGEVAAESCTERRGICFLDRLSSRLRGDLCNSILFQHCQGYARTRSGQLGRTRAVCRTLRAPRDAAQGQVQPLSERVHHVLGRRQSRRLRREQGLAAASLPGAGASLAG